MGLITQRTILTKAVLRDEVRPIIESEIEPVAETALAAAERAEVARLRGLACLLRSGAEPMEGDLDMGNHRIVNEQHGGRP